MVNSVGPTMPVAPSRQVKRKSDANTAEMPMTEGTDSQQRTMVFDRRKGGDRRRKRRAPFLDLRTGGDRRRDSDYPSVDIDV